MIATAPHSNGPGAVATVPDPNDATKIRSRALSTSSLILRASTYDDNPALNLLLFLRGHFLTMDREVFNLGAFFGGLLRGFGGHVDTPSNLIARFVSRVGSWCV